jgi:hypothetical protein
VACYLVKRRDNFHTQVTECGKKRAEVESGSRRKSLVALCTCSAVAGRAPH